MDRKKREIKKLQLFASQVYKQGNGCYKSQNVERIYKHKFVGVHTKENWVF